MNKGLITHVLDFEILPTVNTKKIIFLDLSEYYEEPETPIIKVVPPGHSKYFLSNIEAGKVNILNSNTLGYTQVVGSECLIDLADGIWEFTYSICPYKYFSLTKNYLKTSRLELALAELYHNISDLSCIKNELIEIHILLESAKANLLFNNIDKANKDFSLAQSKVKKLVKNGL